MTKKTNSKKATKKVAKKSAKDLKAIAAADQENARLDAERAAAPDGMTASERAMATSAKPAAAAKGKGKKAKAEATKTDALPAPDALAAALVFDKKDRKWDVVIREGKTDHHVLEQRFEDEASAEKAGAAWIAAYTKAKDAARRKLLGWKATDAKGQAKDATGANVAQTGAKGGKAKRAPKAKKESTRGPSGLDVAAQMLKDAGTPMKCKDVVEQMLAKGLWQTNGKTPAATIYAAIIREIAEKGKQARFTKTGRGEFAFNASAEGK